MDGYRVAIVIPAFNEAATIATVVNTARQHGQPIVINDGSTDETAQAAERAGAILVNHGSNKGYDAALNAGFNTAARLKFDFIITLDADGQHDPSLLSHFVKKLADGASLVLGVRSAKARFAEHLFALYTRLRYGVLDPLCGMKGYHRDVYEMLGYFDSYQSIGTELMLRTVTAGLRFEQVHFTVRKRVDTPRFGRLFSSNAKIMRAFFYWLFG